MRLLTPGKMPLNELQRKLGDSHLSPNLGLLVSYNPLADAERSGPYYLGVGTISDSSLWKVITLVST